MKETIITVKKEFVAKYKKGYSLILEEALENPMVLKEEGQLITLIDDKKAFLGKGYYGNQNKGCGWILSNSKNSNVDYKFFYDKLRNAFSKRMKYYHSRDTSAFRVFNGEGDGIYEKKRFEENGMVVDEDSYLCGKKAPEPLIVKENGVNFAIYLNDGAMVGVFLDQKEVRKSIKEKYSKNKRILNTFSYTGAFSMAAAKGGAITTSVDLASRSLEKTTENFKINNIDPEKHDIIVEDIFHYFKCAKKEELKFDVVILDPPSFATSKDNRFSAAKDYKDLMKSAIEITEDEGVIVASTNCATFNMAKFKKFIDDAFKELHKNYGVLEEHSLPEDFAVTEKFPEGNYLKVVFVRVY